MISLSDKNATTITPLKKTYNIWWKNLTFETGKLALFSNWSITISDDNDNVLLVTVWIKEVWLNEEADFFPLVVDFQEKYYATWKIAWNRFQKRELKPSDEAMLTARMIDRPIRPMFPKWLINDIQIIASVLSSDSNSEIGSWWITWSSLILLIAWAPFEGPVAWVKIALMDNGSYIYDPNLEDEKIAKLNIVVAWTLDAIIMVEAWWNEVTNSEMIKTLEFAHEIIKQLCNAQNDFINLYKKKFSIKQITPVFNNPDESLFKKVKNFLTAEKLECLYDKWKKEFQTELDNLDIEVKKFLISEWLVSKEDNLNFIWALVYKRIKQVMRENILKNERRFDSRKIDEIRPIKSETSLLPRTHGSALFQRGMTQALSIVTLGWPDDEQIIDGMQPETKKRYIHHYNFPPFSVWEVRMMRWVSRREIGHGRLAEKALEAVLPSEDEFPYVIRVVSEIITCNGSSSMASVCWSTLSLMNAWVPIKRPVAWVAMGMIYDEDTWKYKILSDIQAQEDFLWDMDLKLARTQKGITAMQLDVKIKWLKIEVFEKAFNKGEQAIKYILDNMLKAQPKVAENLSVYAPLIIFLQVPEDKISAIIWKWWENIQRIEKKYEVKVSITDNGKTTITAKNQESWNKAIVDIKDILWEPKVWYKWEWKVVRILDWIWAIIEFKWWSSGMIHISKFSNERITKVDDVVKVGDEVNFEVIQVDKEKGRVWLKLIKKD